LNALKRKRCAIQQRAGEDLMGWFEEKTKEIRTKEDAVAYMEWMAGLPVEKPTSVLGI
jgi:hypothetical protein